MFPSSAATFAAYDEHLLGSTGRLDYGDQGACFQRHRCTLGMPVPALGFILEIRGLEQHITAERLCLHCLMRTCRTTWQGLCARADSCTRPPGYHWPMFELVDLYLQLIWQHDPAARPVVVTEQLMQTAGAILTGATRHPVLQAPSALLGLKQLMLSKGRPG